MLTTVYSKMLTIEDFKSPDPESESAVLLIVPDISIMKPRFLYRLQRRAVLCSMTNWYFDVAASKQCLPPRPVEHLLTVLELVDAKFRSRDVNKVSRDLYFRSENLMMKIIVWRTLCSLESIQNVLICVLSIVVC
jgi:hypothetical protein